MENKINELYSYIKDIQKTVQEIRTTQKGYMSDNQAHDIAAKLVDTIENHPAQYFQPENFEFEISGSDRVEVYDCDIRVDDNDLLHDDIVETLLDYYGEPKPEPPKDMPVQFNSVAEEKTSDTIEFSKESFHSDENNAQTGALAK